MTLVLVDDLSSLACWVFFYISWYSVPQQLDPKAAAAGGGGGGGAGGDTPVDDGPGR